MCANYDPLITQDKFSTHFNLDTSDLPGDLKSSLWPGYFGPSLRKHEFADVGDEAVQYSEMLVGSFGLIPHWSKDNLIARKTYNARSETVHEKPSYRDARRTPAGEVVHSFTMHTINANDHAVMCQFHKSDDEKRMVVILNDQNFDTWLQASATESRDFLKQYPAENLQAVSKASGRLF